MSDKHVSNTNSSDHATLSLQADNSGSETGSRSPDLSAGNSPDAAGSGDVFVTSTLTDAVFDDGTTISGSWTAEYSASGSLVGISNSELFVTSPPGANSSTETLTGAYGSGGFSSSGSLNATDGSYQLLFPGFGSNGYGYAYLDWTSETPGSLAATEPNGQYTSIATTQGGPAIALQSGGTIVDTTCFAEGTRIATPAGEVLVEALSRGDVVLLADGREAPVRWMGHVTVATRFADPVRVMPIRVRAGALDEAVPSRDLLVSPCHALLVDGVLVQAGALVNGVTITRETAMPDTFTYYHVELADHALILAEGAPAETFVDNVGRMAFDNWAEHAALFGDEADIAEMPHPRAKSARQVPAAIFARLVERARGGTRKAA